MLQMDNLFNGAWGYDNDISIAALKWAYEEKKLDPSSYITPRAQGKPYETVAFHFIRLAYNPYCKYVLKDEDKMLSYEHFGFKSSFLETIGLSEFDMKDVEEVIEESEMETLDEFFDTQPNYN